MPVYHIGKSGLTWENDALQAHHAYLQKVIFRLKPSATQESITQFKEKGAAMVGKIPGKLPPSLRFRFQTKAVNNLD